MAWWLWSCLFDVSPQFNYILIEKNELPLKLLTGEVLQLNPQDRIRILEISTNICFNYGVRLISSRFDVNALLYEAMTFSTLLSNRDIFNRYKFRVEVKRYNHEMGHMDIVVEPNVQDWLDRAERIIDKTKRVAMLERALKLVPNDHRIRDRLILEYKSLKSLPKVAQLLENMAREKPDQKILYDLLEVYEAMSKTDKMIFVLRKLVMISSDDVDVRLRLAFALEEAGEFKGAIKEYEELLKRMGREDRLPINKTLGYLYTKTNQIRKAISSYLNAVALDKKDVNLYYNLSSLYEEIGQKDKSDFFLKKAVSLKSKDIESRLKLAERMFKKGKLKEAEKYISEVLKRKSDSTEALLLMVKIQERQGNKKALKNIYEKLLSMDPNNEIIIHNLGALEFETGNLSASLKYFQRLVTQHPRDVELRSFLFDIYRSQKKDDLAFQEAQTLTTLRPKEIGPYNYMFEYLNRRGSYKKMIEIMKNALKSNPKNTDLREYLTLAYLKTGKEDLALNNMEEVLKLKPKDILTLLRLARLSEKRGKIEKALKAYKKILDISPSHEEAQEAYLRLRLEVLPLERE